MSFQPSWRLHDTGWFPIPINNRAFCLHCKGELRKLHGTNKYPAEDGTPLVMAFFAFGSGPWCLHCAVREAWQQKDFFRQSGSNEYSSRNFDLQASLRPKFPSIAEEMKKL